MNDHELAAALAADAGALLLALRPTISDPTALKAAGDARANELILDRLRPARPDDAILSEESADDLARLDHERVWIGDPLDGTREYGELDRDDWAVHVALAIGGTAAVGAVALPAQGITYATEPAVPLADWTDDDVWAYVRERELPVNELHARGYASIGCTHCTAPGTGREGRWAGTDRTECGLHT